MNLPHLELLSPSPHSLTGCLLFLPRAAFCVCHHRSAVNVRNANSFNPADKKSILEKVEASVGSAKLNELVSGLLNDALLLRGHAQLERLAPDGELHGVLTVSVARLNQQRGNYEAAKKLFEEALRAWRQNDRCTEERRADQLAMIMTNLSGLLAKMDDLTGAKAMMEQTMEIQRKSESPHLNKTMSNYATLLMDMGDSAGSEKMMKEVLAAKLAASGGARDESTLSTMFNQASALYQNGDKQGAIKLSREVLTARRELLGDRHPATLKSMFNLGQMINKGAEAKKLCQDAVNIARETLGPKHETTIRYQGGLKNIK